MTAKLPPFSAFFGISEYIEVFFKTNNLEITIVEKEKIEKIIKYINENQDDLKSKRKSVADFREKISLLGFTEETDYLFQDLISEYEKYYNSSKTLEKIAKEYQETKNIKNVFTIFIELEHFGPAELEFTLKILFDKLIEGKNINTLYGKNNNNIYSLCETLLNQIKPLVITKFKIYLEKQHNVEYYDNIENNINSLYNKILKKIKTLI